VVAHDRCAEKMRAAHGVDGEVRLNERLGETDGHGRVRQDANGLRGKRDAWQSEREHHA